KARIRSLARKNLLLVLITRTEAALVSTAGAAINDSSANGFDERSGAAGMPPLQRAEQGRERRPDHGHVDQIAGPNSGRGGDEQRAERVRPPHQLVGRALRGVLDQDAL